MAYRELDQLILLFTIEEGADRIRSLQRITFAGQVGLEEQMQTSLQGIAKKAMRGQSGNWLSYRDNP